MSLIFVYGTLKRGDVRSRALAGQTFLGECRTQPLYRLWDCGDYPALTQAGENGRSIEGELYDVDAECLSRLDDVEGVDDGLYSRDVVRLLPPRDRQRVEAYFYRLPVEGLPDCGERWISKGGPPVL